MIPLCGRALACRAQRSNTFSFPEALSGGKTPRRRRARGRTAHPRCWRRSRPCRHARRSRVWSCRQHCSLPARTAVSARRRPAAPGACAPGAQTAPRWSCGRRCAASCCPRCPLPGRRRAGCSRCRRAPARFPVRG